MSRRTKVNTSLVIPTTPQFETRAKRPLFDGLWPGTNGRMWLWRSVPMGSVPDARNVENLLGVGAGLSKAYEGLAMLAGRGSHRAGVKSTYRDTHALLYNIPDTYRADPRSPIADYLNREQGDDPVLKRGLLFGVELRPTTGTGTIGSAIDSVMETLMYGGSPLSDYEKDHREVAGMLARAGFSVPTPAQMRLADSWWNYGLTKGVPVLPHDEHMHYFHSAAAARLAVSIDKLDCGKWPADLGEHAVSFAAVEDFELEFRPATDPISHWVLPMLDNGARIISVRAKVEPQKVTRNELRGQQRRYRADLAELAQQNKADRAEIAEREQNLTSIERMYANGEGPATLTNTSVIVGFSGVIDDIDKYAPPALQLSPMLNRQPTAWHETMVCSAVRANPLEHDLPQTMISFSGLPSLTQVGDADGALLGFTERDRQPGYLSPTAASTEDGLPICGVYAATGAGKTLLLQYLANQFHRLKHPQVIIDPKQKSDLSAVVAYAGGRTISLDDFTTQDGPLDPLRIFPSRADAITKASSMIERVNPYGDDRVKTYSTDLAYAIKWAVDNGAKATGQALQMAYEEKILTTEQVQPIFRYAEVYPMFRVTFGMSGDAEGLELSDGLTYVHVGDSAFELPNINASDGDRQEPTIRNSMNVIRMLIWGSLASLRGRGGVIHFDESWVMEKAASEDLDQVGRLARQWDVLPILYTQKPSGQLNIGLKGYISRALIGHIKDPVEARAALELFGLEDNRVALERITAERYDGTGSGLNWNSLQHLPHPEDPSRALRGSVFYYADLRSRFAAVEVRPSDEFIKMASSRPEDVARREREKEGSPIAA
ncbi:ATP-binding protein [Microbacterium xylanilyticum]